MKINNSALSNSSSYFSLYQTNRSSHEVIGDAFSGKKHNKEPKRYVGQNLLSGLKFKKKKKTKEKKNDQDAFSLSFRDQQKIKKQNASKSNQDKLFQGGVLPDKKWKRR
jgi:hypothetical protein